MLELPDFNAPKHRDTAMSLSETSSCAIILYADFRNLLGLSLGSLLAFDFASHGMSHIYPKI